MSRGSLMSNSKRCLLGFLLAGAAGLASWSSVGAVHDLYEYKLPCVPADACYVTQLAHVGNALDFDPQGSAGLGDIPAVSEGTFQGYFTANDSCTWPGGMGLGRFAVITDVHGRTLRYGHLGSFGFLQGGQKVQQGDFVGVEGNTGYTINCAPHLHLEQIATASGINGVAMSSIAETVYQSTNSRVGNFTLGGAAIREKYDLMAWPYGSSWAAAGYTYDPSQGQVGCAYGTYCQLYVHYNPNVIEGHWGNIQNFRIHQDAAGHSAQSIQWHRWSGSNDAYIVRRDDDFFDKWWNKLGYNPINGVSYDMGLALMDRWGPYQRFHVGYVRALPSGTIARYCPDVALPGPANPGNYDGAVSGFDMFAVLDHFNVSDNGLDPFEVWPNSWFDITGDGSVAGGDLFAVLSGFNLSCV